MSEEKIILPESDEAAVFQYLVGWVSRGGRFYGTDEQAARWGGATHVKCSKCGKPTKKSYTACKKCREEKAAKKYLKLPMVKWDESVPVYSPVTDTYYWSREEVQDSDHHGLFDSRYLQLVLCKPVYAPEIDPEAYYENLLPEYDDLSDVSQDLVDIFQELNSALSKLSIILSYEPVDIAAI